MRGLEFHLLKRLRSYFVGVGNVAGIGICFGWFLNWHYRVYCQFRSLFGTAGIDAYFGRVGLVL